MTKIITANTGNPRQPIQVRGEPSPLIIDDVVVLVNNGISRDKLHERLRTIADHILSVDLANAPEISLQ